MRISTKNSPPLHLRIFLASPGDVAEERKLAHQVIDALPYDPALRGKITVEIVAWDKFGPPMQAGLTPQEAINQGMSTPSQCDIVLVILWSRIGTALPPDYAKPDDSPYLSGTEWEYWDALNAYQIQGKPIVLVYRRSEKLLIDPDAPDAEEKFQQRKKLNAFFDGCKNPDGSHRDGLNDYDTPAQFKELLARHLAAKIHPWLADSTAHPPGDPHPKPAKPGPTWDIATLGPPYRGLQALTDKHADLFFGRKEELNRLAEKLASQRFVVVVGASGAGKSSLVWAGLLPKLNRWKVGNMNPWLWVRMTPAENKDDEDFAPVKVLAGVLAKALGQDYFLVKKALQAGGAELQQLLDAMTTEPAGQLLVFVDQFEELFSLVAPPLRKPFINALDRLMATGKVRVVATMRAEFLGQCMDCEEFGKHLADWFNGGQLLLAAPDAEDLHPMVEGPAQLAGLAFEARLADQIVKDTGLKPGNLALMAFALERLYEQRQGQLLTWQAYQDFGGIDGAIADKADQVFKTSTAQGIASPEALSSRLGDVFRELVEIDEHSGAATRRRVPLSLWGLGHDRRSPTTPAQQLIGDFIAARLLLTDNAIEGEREPTLEVAHEALFRNWPLLKDWIDARKDQFLMRKRLQRDAAEWARRGEPDAFRWLDPLALEAGGMIRALRYQATDREARFLGPVQREDMLRLIQVADTSHELRATLGVRLALLGDDRPGVGVKDGLPDIVWCKVPPGRVKLEEDAGSFDVEACRIAKYPVTQAQYRLFIEAEDGFANPEWWDGLPERYYPDPGRQIPPHGNHPAVNVAWIEAMAYCRWLSHKLGQAVRLPTEWEWQQAASLGNPDNTYPWGKDWDGQRCNSYESQLNRTIAVGLYAHEWPEDRAVDMAGNVWEWCLNEYAKPMPLNEISFRDKADRTVRGGSWDGRSVNVRCAIRGWSRPNDRSDSFGLRLALGSPW